MYGSYRWLLFVAAAVTAAPEARQLAPFNSIEVRGGAHVMLQASATPRVRWLQGSTDVSRVVVNDGELRIDKCRTKCPKGYQLELEVFAPTVTRIVVAHGGRIESRDRFPRQAELTLAVDNGGTIDARSFTADRVNASIRQGGGILTAPRVLLAASVAHGGNITYWGDPQVRSSIDHPGAVQRAAN